MHLQPALRAIIAHVFWMKKESYRLATIRNYVNTLKAVCRRADLLNPKAVKIHLAARPKVKEKPGFEHTICGTND